MFSSNQYKTTKRIFVFITKCNIAKSILTISKGQRITILIINENRLVNRKNISVISAWIVTMVKNQRNIQRRIWAFSSVFLAFEVSTRL